MEIIEKFTSEGFELINKWKESKNKIISKTKKNNENKTSIETLERNFGIDNILIRDLKKTINENNNDIDIDLKQFSFIEKNIDDLKNECVKSLKLILELHNRLSNETEIECEIIENKNDPIGVQTAKTLWGKLDNHQLRSDPPIMGILKDEFRKDLVDKNLVVENNIASSSNLDEYFAAGGSN